MYQGTFERPDLGGVISNDELGKVETRLLQAGETTPVPTCMTRAVATLNRYAAQYLLDDDLAKRHLGVLTVYYLYERQGQIPTIRQRAFDDTMSELRGIRDGKFSDLPLDGNASPTESAPAAAAFGGERRIHTNRSRGRYLSGCGYETD